MEPDAARRFALWTSLTLVAATALLALGVERLSRGAEPLGYTLLVLGGLATAAAFGQRLPGDARGRTLLLLTRDECVHCEEAHAILRALQDEAGFDLWVADVGHDPELLARHGDEVPVLYADGEIAASLTVSEADVRRLLV